MSYALNIAMNGIKLLIKIKSITQNEDFLLLNYSNGFT